MVPERIILFRADSCGEVRCDGIIIAARVARTPRFASRYAVANCNRSFSHRQPQNPRDWTIWEGVERTRKSQIGDFAIWDDRRVLDWLTRYHAARPLHIPRCIEIGGAMVLGF